MLNKVFEVIEALPEKHFRALVLVLLIVIGGVALSTREAVGGLKGRLEEVRDTFHELLRNQFPGYDVKR